MGYAQMEAVAARMSTGPVLSHGQQAPRPHGRSDRFLGEPHRFSLLFLVDRCGVVAVELSQQLMVPRGNRERVLGQGQLSSRFEPAGVEELPASVRTAGIDQDPRLDA